MQVYSAFQEAMMMRHLYRSVVIALAAAALLGITGCSDSPGTGQRSERVELTFAHIDNDLLLDPAARWFIEDVHTRSHGQIAISFENECCGRENNAQEVLTKGVASGRFDLGWVATRGFEDVGIHSFQALSAPLLIDSYAAEKAVLSSNIGATMLAGLKPAGVTPISLEPGTLRRPIGNDRALLSPKDWKGITFWTYKSDTSAATVTALGARSSQVGNDVRDPELESGKLAGAENSVAWQASSQHVPKAVMVLNEALWPRMSVLMANPRAFGKLTAQQRSWIRAAALATSKRTSEVEHRDVAAVATSCGNGDRFATASPADLAATAKSLKPVFARIEGDSVTKNAIVAIRTLKPKGDPSKEYSVPESCRLAG
jgi:TRAP-type C4-dicarboxylate transport system substrate-binding protein